MENSYIPVIKISERAVVTYSLPLTRPRRTEKQEETKKNLVQGKTKGVISEKARRRLRQISEGWLLSIQEAKKRRKSKGGKDRRYITFVTLTLSAKQEHSDLEIKRELLNHFLITVQRQFHVREYVWRAESQKNGNIHFHLFLDKYIHYKQLRNLWNRTQERLGYLTRFKRIYGHKDANSTDIERIRSAKGATIYVSKYIAKESDNRTIEGRVWGCSDNLKKICPFQDVADSRHYELVEELKNDKTIKQIYEEHYSVFCGDIKDIITRSYPEISKALGQHYLDNFKMLYG